MDEVNTGFNVTYTRTPSGPMEAKNFRASRGNIY